MSEIAKLTAPEVAARIAAGAPVVLPMGSLETHGPQAPMGDFLVAAEIARRIAPPKGPPPRKFLARVLRAEHWRLLRGAPLPYGSAIAAGTLFSLFPG